MAPIYGISPDALSELDKRVGRVLTEEGTQLRFADRKSLQGTIVISYAQAHFGLPIWEAGLSVTLQDNPLRVTSSHSTLHHDIKIERPRPDSKFLQQDIDASTLADVLGLAQAPRAVINRTRLLVYRYDPALRFDPESTEGRRAERGAPLEGGPPTLPLPPVPASVEPGRHYVVQEVLFTLPINRWKVNWRALVEVETGAVLYLRAFVASATGRVFATDPLTATGDPTITPLSSVADLNPLRTTVTLEGLVSGNPQALVGGLVQIAEREAPIAAAPAEPNPPADFTYDVPTDNFAAVNTYYHCDAMFRLVEGMGFPIASFFGQTSFPVPADHRGKNGQVNAHCAGNPMGNGVGEFSFGVAAEGSGVSIAADLRVVLHEFGHALLWDSVSSPNFGFAHSAGDSLAAILLDPGSSAPDRFATFPWITAARRHDRDVVSGWAWGGSNDVGSYSSEQILSTTLFRIYRSTGGDSAHGDPVVKLARQRFAARFMAYLITRGIGSLATSPITPTPTPDVFATALMNADVGTASFEGHPGGAFHKVIRWGFEKQGLYQPPGAPSPVTSAGAPPEIDVYINDGRDGEYQYRENFWDTTDIWNRLAADGGLAHQHPIITVPNYVYVRVKNRGSLHAAGVVVRGYHCKPAAGLVWPDDWQAMTTAELPVPGGIAPGGDVVVGPFEWVPEVVGHECLLMSVSAAGDLSNVDPASMLPSATGPIPHWRLVPFDNNIAQRNVAPVPGGGGGLQLENAFKGRRFTVKNPYKRVARITLEAILPELLQQRGWALRFGNGGGGAFRLGARASREVVLALVRGQDFKPADVPSGANLHVHVLLDGQLIGGMTYAIDPTMTKPAVEIPIRRAPRRPRRF